MAAPKLTSNQQEAVIQWLCEGLGNNEVIEQLNAAHGVTLDPSAITYYRKTHADEIDEAREEALQRAMQQGFANRLRRLEALQRNAERAVELTRAGGKGWTYVSAELRAILKDIRDELGDLKQRHEHTGAGGGAVQVAHELNADELGDALDGLLARVRAGVAGGTGALDVETTPADD